MNQKKTTRPKPKKQNRNKNQHRKQTKASREYSAGGFVFRTGLKGPEFLLIRDHKDRWSIAKGKIESEETPEIAALREITEETGIETLRICDKLNKIYFFYRLKNRLIFMTTWVFLVEALRHDEIPQVEAEKYWIAEAKWFSVEEARAALGYKDLQDLLELAIKKVEARLHSS